MPKRLSKPRNSLEETGSLPVQSDQLSRAQLSISWAEIYGRAPPKGISTRLLTLAVQYNEQTVKAGGLKASTRKRLLSLIVQSAPLGGKHPTPRAPSKAETGTRLVRQWQGKTHIVDIGKTGVHYQGRTYRSLSAVAKAITGAHWSGPRFFGL